MNIDLDMDFFLDWVSERIRDLIYDDSYSKEEILQLKAALERVKRLIKEKK